MHKMVEWTRIVYHDFQGNNNPSHRHDKQQPQRQENHQQGKYPGQDRGSWQKKPTIVSAAATTTDSTGSTKLKTLWEAPDDWRNSFIAEWNTWKDPCFKCIVNKHAYKIRPHCFEVKQQDGKMKCTCIHDPLYIKTSDQNKRPHGQN